MRIVVSGGRSLALPSPWSSRATRIDLWKILPIPER
jgi:hypothetical protein